MLDPDDYDWFEEVSDAHKLELQRFRRAIRRAGDQFGFYVFIARPTLHDALLRQIVQAGLDELQCVIATEWIEDDDLRASVEALLQRRGAMFEGLALPGDALVAHSDGALVSALNLGRERLAEVVRGPFVLCLSESAYERLPDLASDLWSARSGTFTFEGPSRLRTTLAMGAIVRAQDGQLVRIQKAQVAEWRSNADACALGELSLRELSRWRERLLLLQRCGALEKSWLRCVRRFAERAESLDDWDSVFRFRQAELICRELAGQSVVGRGDKFLAAGLRSSQRSVRIFALARDVVANSASIEEVIARCRSLLLEGAYSMGVIQDIAQACAASSEALGASSAMLGFFETELRARVPQRKLWLSSEIQRQLVRLLVSLGDRNAARHAVDSQIALLRSIHDSVGVALWLIAQIELSDSPQEKERARREFDSLAQRYGLVGLQREAVAGPL